MRRAEWPSGCPTTRAGTACLSPDDLLSGTIIRHITDPAFDVPTTVASFGNALCAVNARLGVADPVNADYDVVRALKQ